MMLLNTCDNGKYQKLKIFFKTKDEIKLQIENLCIFQFKNAQAFLFFMFIGILKKAT